MARLLFFGKLVDLAGARARDFVLPAGVVTVEGLIGAIADAEKELGAALGEKSVRFAVNEAIVGSDTSITDNDEIAFLPPASGG